MRMFQWMCEVTKLDRIRNVGVQGSGVTKVDESQRKCRNDIGVGWACQ